LITRNELSEAKTICNVRDPSTWQKRRLITLAIKEATFKVIDVQPGEGEEDLFNDFFNQAKNHFKNETIPTKKTD
jgi:hypothetical protein